MEEGTELLGRLKYAWGLDAPAHGAANDTASGEAGHGEAGHGHGAPGVLPMFTSCCPVRVAFVVAGLGLAGAGRPADCLLAAKLPQDLASQTG